MHGDAELVLSLFVIAEILQVVHRLVLCQYTQIGGDVILAINGVATGELVVDVEREFAMVADEIDCAMLQHGEVLALNHAAHERLGRVFCGVVLTLVAYSSGAFYLLIDTEFSRILEPNLIFWSFYFHCIVLLIWLQRYIILGRQQNN